ncbi:MAG: TIGR00645 family protein [Hyphomicrobiaceae bacterium]
MTDTKPDAEMGYAKSLERLVERTILASRWLLVVFYVVLAAALGIYAISFIAKFLHLVQEIFHMGEDEIILAMLSLIDASLVASLIVMVMISGYENFVSRFDQANTELTWLGKLDAGSLKIKVASAIVAISSIHLLQIFLNASKYANDKIMWSLLLHITFIASAVFLGVLDRMMHTTAKHPLKADGPKMHVAEKN